jgi:HTH-type transcriptional regulator / antitoxin HipB
MGEMRIRNIRELGAYLRVRRTELGMDQATLARKAGTSRKWLIEVESGKPGAELGLVLRTLRALEVAIDLSAEAPASKPAKVLKPKASKKAAGKRAKWPHHLSGQHNSAGDIDQVLRSLKKAALRR